MAAPTPLFEARQLSADGSYRANHANAADLLFFPARYYEDGSQGSKTVDKYDVESWRTDGTEQGTQLLIDLNPGPGGSSARAFTVFGNKVVFLDGDAIWVTDGTESGTLRVKSCSGRNSTTLVHAGSCLLFTAYRDGGNGLGLRRTDGTPMGYPVPQRGFDQVAHRRGFAACNTCAGQALTFRTAGRKVNTSPRSGSNQRAA